MKIFFATHNPGKAEEARAVLNVEIITPLDLNENEETEENGASLQENAYIKAKYYYDKYHYPTLADDTALEVKALNGRPGIHSHRYCPGSDLARCNMLLKEMQGMTKRDARFVCVLCFIENDIPYYFKGVMSGKIGSKITLGHGFGYDSVFLYQNKYLSRYTLSEKNTFSHRMHALHSFSEFLKKRYLQAPGIVL